MLRIADNFGDYYAYQLKLIRDKKVKAVDLSRLDTKLGTNNDANSFGKHNHSTNNFNELLEEETKKYR